MLESWSPLEIIGGLCLVVAVVAPPLYAWCDRWLDRSRNAISDKVDSDSKSE